MYAEDKSPITREELELELEQFAALQKSDAEKGRL